MSKNPITFARYFAAVLIMALACETPACPVENADMDITVNGHKLNAEVAIDRAGHRCGLAFRNTLAADRGMLFVYKQDRVLRFWMRDTRIDLSIAFLDRDGRILEMQDMNSDTPLRTTISAQPARYALEVNQGWFAERGIKAGDRVVFDLPSNTAIISDQAEQ